MLAEHGRVFTLCNYQQSVSACEPVKFWTTVKPLYKSQGKLKLLACSCPSAMTLRQLRNCVTFLRKSGKQVRQDTASSLSSPAHSTARLIEYEKDKQFRIGLFWSVHNTPLLGTGFHSEATTIMSNDRCVRRTRSS